MNSQIKKKKVETLVVTAMMTALVVVFQCIATYTAWFGPFSTAISLIPIVIGAAMCGPLAGAWLGLVFGVVVLSTGGAALFMTFDPFGTYVTVLLKGMACGFAAGIVNKLLKKFNKTVAAVTAAIICPIVNTGVFLLGGLIFFLPYAESIAGIVQLEESGFAVFIALAAANFLFELGMNILLSPVIVRVLDIVKKNK
jgi:uncharacterized membrane protein